MGKACEGSIVEKASYLRKSSNSSHSDSHSHSMLLAIGGEPATKLDTVPNQC